MAKKDQSGSSDSGVGGYTPPPLPGAPAGTPENEWWMHAGDSNDIMEAVANQDVDVQNAFMDDLHSAMQNTLYGNTYNTSFGELSGETLFDESLADPQGAYAQWVQDNWNDIDSFAIDQELSEPPPADIVAPPEPPPTDGLVGGVEDVVEPELPQEGDANYDAWMEDVLAQMEATMFGNLYDVDGEQRTGEQLYNWSLENPEGGAATWVQENWNNIDDFLIPQEDGGLGDPTDVIDSGGGDGDNLGGGGGPIEYPGDGSEPGPPDVPPYDGGDDDMLGGGGGGEPQPGDDNYDQWLSDVNDALMEGLFGNTYYMDDKELAGETIYNWANANPEGYTAQWLQENWQNIDDFLVGAEEPPLPDDDDGTAPPVDEDVGEDGYPTIPEPLEGYSVSDPEFLDYMWRHLAEIDDPLVYDLHMNTMMNAQRELTDPDAFSNEIIINETGDVLPGWEGSTIKQRGPGEVG